MTIISKAALAAELGVSKARVSQYVARGLPVRSDGKLDREAAVKWIADNHANYESARTPGVNRAVVLAKRPKREVAAQPERSPVDAAMMLALRHVFDLAGPIIAKAALEAGASMPTAYALMAQARMQLSDEADEFLARVVPGYGDDEDATVLFDPTDPDWPALAAEHDQPFDLAACEALVSDLPFFR